MANHCQEPCASEAASTAASATGGAFGVSEALAAPQLVRLVDRFGQTRMLPPALLGHAVAVAVLVSLVTAGACDALLVAGGAQAGAGVPQLGAMSAARWAALLRPGRAPELPTAFALESVSDAVGYLVGPASASALAAAGHALAGTVLAASVSVTGALLLGTLLLLTVDSPVCLGLVVVLTGATVPPLLALFSVLTGSVVHQSVLTQAFSWLGSASAAGSPSPPRPPPR
ncbi:hypothetical protein ACFV2H_36955 [Streptomyces sp. NPDC059629]|uniref:hypothetical protein n=1 Tax=Streptomyces sp. NPDC059629 TaxID=3346889 RepID=UPI00369EF57B